MRPIICLLFFVSLASPLVGEPAQQPRHLLIAKFTLERFDEVDLTEDQRTEFNRLSAELRNEIDALRRNAGISKSVMRRRDAAHRELKDLKLEEEAYWTRLKKAAELDDQQLEAFRATAIRFERFKKDSTKILTKEQKTQRKDNQNRKREAESIRKK